MNELSLDPGTVILVVDDDPLCCAMIRHMLEPDDVLLIDAASIARARDLLENNSAVRLDLILLDRGLPDGDGFELLQHVRQIPGLERVPVIIQSGFSDVEDVDACIRMGAFHYLAKPYKRDMLRALVRVAIREYREQRFLVDQQSQAEDVWALAAEAEFKFRTLDDVKTLVPFLSRFFPNSEPAAIGASELMINAIEHGNLEISYDFKGKLIEDNRWNIEIANRLSLPEYAGRFASVRVIRTPQRIELLITDQGLGFNWREYETINPERLYDLHGRGIAVVREHCFDGLEYLGAGNQVRAWCALPVPTLIEDGVWAN